jgi:hypothetical protein
LDKERLSLPETDGLRYRFFAWLDKRTEYVLGTMWELSYIKRSEPQVEYSLSDQLTLIGHGLVYLLLGGFDWILNVFSKIIEKFTVKKK